MHKSAVTRNPLRGRTSSTPYLANQYRCTLVSFSVLGFGLRVHVHDSPVANKDLIHLNVHRFSYLPALKKILIIENSDPFFLGFP